MFAFLLSRGNYICITINVYTAMCSQYNRHCEQAAVTTTTTTSSEKMDKRENEINVSRTLKYNESYKHTHTHTQPYSRVWLCTRVCVCVEKQKLGRDENKLTWKLNATIAKRRILWYTCRSTMFHSMV